jgi:uncharacterized protein
MALRVIDKKFYRYLYLRLTRQRGTPHDLSLSVAIGIFFGFLVPLFQMFLAVFVAWTFRVNKVVAAGCTWISNPLTYPLIFPVNIYIGSFFIDSEFDWDKLNSFTFSSLFKDFKQVLYFFLSDGMLMFMIGGGILGIIVALLSYVSVFYSITKHQKEKAARFIKRRQALKEKKGISG